VGREILAHVRRRSPGGTADLALALRDLAHRLGALGRDQESLAATEEAVIAYRRLARTHPDSYLPALAAALSDLADRLGAVGQRRECLTATEEAVAIRRRLAKADPGAHLSMLATTLNNLGPRTPSGPAPRRRRPAAASTPPRRTARGPSRNGERSTSTPPGRRDQRRPQPYRGALRERSTFTLRRDRERQHGVCQ
jgi:hypothetical protein